MRNVTSSRSLPSPASQRLHADRTSFLCSGWTASIQASGSRSTSPSGRPQICSYLGLMYSMSRGVMDSVQSDLRDRLGHEPETPLALLQRALDAPPARAEFGE